MAKMQSASGYASLESTPLNRPGYFNEILGRIWERDFLPEITNNQIDERITYCHQQVQIMKAPEVGPWRTYQKNQEMVPNQVSTDALTLEICNAAYNAIKIDQLDIRFACNNWDQWEEKFLDSVYHSYVDMQREWVLTAMILEADPRNRGSKAGKFGNVDLGSLGNPIEVNKDNIALRFAQLQNVLLEQLRWKDGEMFAVVPVQFRPVFVQSNFANSSWAGSCKPCSVAIDGMWDNQISGFNIIETTQAPFVIGTDGRVCFYVIAGHRSAFAYAADIVDARVVQPDRTWSAEYQMLAVWGGKMLYPEAVAVAYWTFSIN